MTAGVKIPGRFCIYCKSLSGHRSYWSWWKQRCDMSESSSFCDYIATWRNIALVLHLLLATAKGKTIVPLPLFFPSRFARPLIASVAVLLSFFLVLLSLSEGKWRARQHNRWLLTPLPSPEPTQWPVPSCPFRRTHCEAEFISGIRPT